MDRVDPNVSLCQDFSLYFPEIGKEIWCYQELPRAMSLAKELAFRVPSGANGRIVTAKTLTHAKGRFERKWLAEEGGLWVAMTIYDEFLETSQSLIPLIPGIVMARCAHHLGVREAKIKWINDLHVNGKKLGGVLIEKTNSWLIIGMGININNPLPSQIPCESFKNLLKREVSVFEVLFLCIYWLRYYFGFLRFYEKCILDEIYVPNLIIEDFKRFSDSLGRCVAFSYNFDKEDFIIARALDITKRGSLILELSEIDSSHIIEVSAGELIYLS